MACVLRAGTIFRRKENGDHHHLLLCLLDLTENELLEIHIVLGRICVRLHIIILLRLLIALSGNLSIFCSVKNFGRFYFSFTHIKYMFLLFIDSFSSSSWSSRHHLFRAFPCIVQQRQRHILADLHCSHCCPAKYYGSFSARYLYSSS